MAFGVENSPTAVTKAQVLTLLEVIDNQNINSTFSGHIQMLTGSINAAQAYMLALKNITYHGETEAVEYNISVDKATPSEGENVTFSVVDDVMPIGVFRFGLSSISNIVGDITEEEIRSLITFDANVMRIADSGKNINWNATIKINSWLIFDEEHKQPTTLTLKGSVKVTSINVVGDEDFTVETLGAEKAYTIEFTPSDYTQPVGNPVLSCEDSRVTFKDITKNRFVAVFNTTATFETDIIVETAGVSFTKHIKVKAAGATHVTIYGDLSFTSIGQKSATFTFDGLVPMSTASAQFESATITYSIMSCDKNGITVKCNSVDTVEENTINLTFEDVEGNVLTAKIDVTNKITPQVAINGDEQFTAKNGSGEGAFTFGYTPANYNVPVSVKGITVTGSGLSVKSGYTKDGFTIVASGLSADVFGTTTAVLVVDGSEVTLVKNVVAKYEEAEVSPPPYDAETLDTLGVAIMDIDGNLYSSTEEWNASGKDTDTELLGLAFSNETIRFVVPSFKKQRGKTYFYGYFTSPNKIYPDYVNATELPFIQTNFNASVLESDIAQMGMTDYKAATNYLKHNIINNYGSTSKADAMFELAEAARTIRTNTGAFCYIANSFILEIIHNKLKVTSDASNMLELISLYGYVACGIDVYYYNNTDVGGFICKKCRTDYEIKNESLSFGFSSNTRTFAFLIYPL